MGIKDLLRFMKPYTESVHIRKYGGKRVGIDAYSWLHKGAYSCSMELCLDSEGDAKFRYISYFMHRIEMLRHYNVIPVVVFDGGNIPCKAATEDERYRYGEVIESSHITWSLVDHNLLVSQDRLIYAKGGLCLIRRRDANRELAMERLKEGNVSGATELFQRAISVTTSMAHQLIQTLRGENVEFLVAPYEADAQLAYLSSLPEEKGGIATVITEDSDLLAYGCSSVIFKMDRYGNGEEILLEKAFSCTNQKPSFQKFNRELFTGMCVLAGCDFLPSVPGIGIGKAYSLVSKYYNIDRALSVLKFQKGKQMPEDYLKSFRQAVAVFQHARIYDKINKRTKHITPLQEELLNALDGELDFLGPDLPPSIATAISEGNLDPLTMESYNCSQTPRRRHQSPSFKQNKDAASPKMLASEPSCFEVFSSCAKKEAKVSNEMAEERRVLKEWNHSTEAAQLAKLIPKPELHITPEMPVNFPKISMKTKENNPFKKTKHEHIIFDRLGSNIEAKQLLNPSMSVDSMLCEKDPLKTPQNNPFKRKFDQVTVDLEGDSFPESCVTEVESTPPMESPVLDSPESVNSKSRKFKGCKKDQRSATRLKESSCKSSASRKSTILDFFSQA